MHFPFLSFLQCVKSEPRASRAGCIPLCVCVWRKKEKRNGFGEENAFPYSQRRPFFSSFLLPLFLPLFSLEKAPLFVYKSSSSFSGSSRENTVGRWLKTTGRLLICELGKPSSSPSSFFSALKVSLSQHRSERRLTLFFLSSSLLFPPPPFPGLLTRNNWYEGRKQQ